MDGMEVKDDFKGLIINQQQDTRMFMCNHCKELNLVHMDDLKKLRGEKMKRKSVHMEIREDLAIAFKRFCANFNGYEGGLVALLNSFEVAHSHSHSHSKEVH